ncbi:hypothetical protein HY837_06600 [archaeon]|nr:hypothetical protein [archaeon]
MSIDENVESTDVLKRQVKDGKAKISQGFAAGHPLEVATGVNQVADAKKKLDLREVNKVIDGYNNDEYKITEYKNI